MTIITYFLLFLTFVFGMEALLQKSQNSIIDCYNTGSCHYTDTFSQQALVVYDEEKIPILHKTKREFDFNGEVIKIIQKWSGLGVAGAVWDSVFVSQIYFFSFSKIIQSLQV